MTSDAKGDADSERRTVKKPRIFISHTHADRKLAQALSKLLTRVTQNVVDVFLSSDPNPGGGIAPGEQWFPKIHRELELATAVWVLATEHSVSRPWIYWEAGIGSVHGSGRVVVVRVGVTDVPSPLSAFQGCAGLEQGDSGLAPAIRKTGAEVGLVLDDVLVDAALGEWIAFAGSFESELADESGEQTIVPERTDRVEALLSRVEALLQREETGQVRPRPASPSESDHGNRFTPEHRRERASAGEPTNPSTTEEARSDSRAVWGRANGAAISSLEAAIDVIEQAPDETEMEVTGFYKDGDLVVVGRRDGRSAPVYLRGDWLDDLRELASTIDSERSRSVLTAASEWIVTDGS